VNEADAPCRWCWPSESGDTLTPRCVISRPSDGISSARRTMGLPCVQALFDGRGEGRKLPEHIVIVAGDRGIQEIQHAAGPPG
jgi:hypothetical protein